MVCFNYVYQDEHRDICIMKFKSIWGNNADQKLMLSITIGVFVLECAIPLTFTIKCVGFKGQYY